MGRLARTGLALAAALVLSLVPHVRLRAAEPQCDFTGVDRVVAVGDVHGAYDQFLGILRAADIVDARGRWSGGKAHLVQLGDVVDRGPDSRKALDFLQRLSKDAKSAGGRVHQLLGNHEAMRLLSDFRYTTPGEYAAFVTPESEEFRRSVIETAPASDREKLLGETPLGKFDMIRAFGPTEEYGTLLRTLNAVERINGIVFVHGGISPEVAPMSCTDINAAVRRDLTANLKATRDTPENSLASKETGPLWYRGLAQETEAFQPRVDEILAAQHAQAIVVAHTVQPSGRIDARFGGKVFVIDTGMQPAYVPTGRASALEIRGGVFTAIYNDSRTILSRVPQ